MGAGGSHFVRSTLPVRPTIRPHNDRPDRTPEPDVTELDLLRNAHVAYSTQDFARALERVREQARRFPNGSLAEEREALRVRSLAAAGRAGEARQAAAAFAEHFPRSVLLSQIQKLRATH